MAHELEIMDGRASFFEFAADGILTAWHCEGIAVTEAPTLLEAIALARLDYPVEKMPVYLNLTDAESGQKYVRRSDMTFSVIRTDRNIELGRVGPDYTPVQNVDAFRAIEPLLESGVCRLETGGVLRDGADAWLLARFDVERFGPVVREVFADEVIPFALFTTNHSGRCKNRVAETPIRVVCANTLQAAEHDIARSGKSVEVSHRGDAPQRMVEAATEMFAGIVERYETIANHYRALKSRILTEQEFVANVLDVVVPDPRKNPKFNPDAKTAEMVIERADRRRGLLTSKWYDGAGHVGDSSAWEAYNGVVEVIDHNVDGLFPTRGGAWRTASLLNGALAERKTAALSSLLTLAGVTDTAEADATDFDVLD